MANAGTISFSFKATGLGAVQKGTEKATNGVSGLAKAAKVSRAQVVALGKAAAAVTAAGLAMGFGMKKLADAAGNFEMELARAGAITNATAQDMAVLEKAAINAGIATQFSPAEAAQGLAVLGSMGLNAAAASQVLTPSLDLAAAGMIGVAEASSAVVNMLRVYDKGVGEAADITDKLVAITNMSGFQASEFAGTLGKAASKTRAANQTFETTVVTMGLLRNAGIDAASAGVAYNRSVTNMATNTKAMNAMQEIGVSFYEKGTKKVRQFTDVVFDLEKGISKLNPKEQMRIKAAVFGARAIGAYTAVTQASIEVIRNGEKVTLRGAEAVAEMRRKLDEAGGAAKKFRERLLNTYEGQKTLLQGTLQTLAIVTGKPFASMFKPIVAGVVDALNQLVQLINRVPERTKKIGAAAAIGFAGLLTAAGMALTAILALGAGATFIVPMISAGIGAIGPILATVAAMASKVLVVLGPILVILGTIILVVGLFYEANERTLGGVADLWNGFVTFAKDMGNGLIEIFRSIGSYIGRVWTGLTNMLSQFWSTMWASISGATKSAGSAVLGAFDKIANKLVRMFGGLADTYGELLFALGYETEAAGLRKTIKDLKNFEGGMKGIFDGLDNFTQPLQNEVVDFVSGSIKGMGELAKFTVGVGKGIGTSLVDGFQMAKTGAGKILGGLMDEVSLALPDILPDLGKGPGGKGGGGGIPKPKFEIPEKPLEDFGGFANALDQMRAQRADRQQGAISAAQGLASGNVAQIGAGVASAMGTALGPVGGAALGLVDSLMSASTEGSKFKEDLAAIFTTVANALNPVFKALRPLLEVFQVIGELFGMVVEVMMSMSLLEPALAIVVFLFRGIALVIKNLMIGFREFYIGLLTLVDMIPGIDMSRQLAELQRAQAAEVRERNELIERMRGEATLDEQRARRERELANATEQATSAMLNVPSGYKVARAGFNAEQPMNDFISRPGQRAVPFSPQDNIIGVKDLGALGGTTIIIQNLDVRADNPTSFFRELMNAVNRDAAAGGVSLGGAFQGRL